MLTLKLQAKDYYFTSHKLKADPFPSHNQSLFKDEHFSLVLMYFLSVLKTRMVDLMSSQPYQPYQCCIVLPSKITLLVEVP